MKYRDIRRYLKPYSIAARRSTTINHAFAASIAPCDSFDDDRVRKAIRLLGQDPDSDLFCAYCGREAETWDHVHATVKDKKFSGFGHRIGNLLPCCKPCNSKKGSKDWRTFLTSLQIPGKERALRLSQISEYLDETCVPDQLPVHLPEYEKLQAIHAQVLELLREADVLATAIRSKSDTAQQQVQDGDPAIGRVPT